MAIDSQNATLMPLWQDGQCLATPGNVWALNASTPLLPLPPRAAVALVELIPEGN